MNCDGWGSVNTKIRRFNSSTSENLIFIDKDKIKFNIGYYLINNNIKLKLYQKEIFTLQEFNILTKII